MPNASAWPNCISYADALVGEARSPIAYYLPVERSPRRASDASMLWSAPMTGSKSPNLTWNFADQGNSSEPGRRGCQVFESAISSVTDNCWKRLNERRLQSCRDPTQKSVNWRWTVPFVTCAPAGSASTDWSKWDKQFNGWVVHALPKLANPCPRPKRGPEVNQFRYARLKNDERHKLLPVHRLRTAGARLATLKRSPTHPPGLKPLSAKTELPYRVHLPARRQIFSSAASPGVRWRDPA